MKTKDNPRIACRCWHQSCNPLMLWESFEIPDTILPHCGSGTSWTLTNTKKCQNKHLLLIIFACSLIFSPLVPAWLPTILTIDMISIRQLLAHHCVVIGFTTAWHHEYLLKLCIAIPWYSLQHFHSLRYSFQASHWLMINHWDWWLANETFTSYSASKAYYIQNHISFYHFLNLFID